jgi:hypothetical protein
MDSSTLSELNLIAATARGPYYFGDTGPEQRMILDRDHDYVASVQIRQSGGGCVAAVMEGPREKGAELILAALNALPALLTSNAALEAENARLKQADADWHRESYDEGYREGNCDAIGAAGELFDLVLKWATGERQLLDHQDQYTAEDLFDAITSHEQQLCENADDLKARVTALEAKLREAEEVVRPFAALADVMAQIPDSYPCFVSGLQGDHAVQAGDMRRARAFLSRAEG